jgi:hypothetical protein
VGHQAHLKGPYRSLLERLNAGTVGLPRPENEEALRGWQELLEIYYTPEEAAMASRMPIKPSPLKAIARRFGEEPAVFEPKLDAMSLPVHEESCELLTSSGLPPGHRASSRLPSGY